MATISHCLSQSVSRIFCTLILMSGRFYSPLPEYRTYHRHKFHLSHLCSWTISWTQRPRHESSTPWFNQRLKPGPPNTLQPPCRSEFEAVRTPYGGRGVYDSRNDAYETATRKMYVVDCLRVVDCFRQGCYGSATAQCLKLEQVSIVT